jgi:hypothetical protein
MNATIDEALQQEVVVKLIVTGAVLGILCGMFLMIMATSIINWVMKPQQVSGSYLMLLAYLSALGISFAVNQGLVRKSRWSFRIAYVVTVKPAGATALPPEHYSLILYRDRHKLRWYSPSLSLNLLAHDCFRREQSGARQTLESPRFKPTNLRQSFGFKPIPIH